jgi:alcohol dehydrogenase/L-iditol 2-dehydrogenase
VAKGGLLSLVGFTREPVELVPMDVVRNQITIRGHLIYDHPADFPATLEAVRAGTLVAEQAVQARYSADDAVAAFAAVREVPGKTWIDFSDWYGTPGG